MLAPIVRHADDAHVPEPTRAPLIERGQALRPGRLRHRPAGDDGAADRLAGLDHLRRQPRRRDPARRSVRARAGRRDGRVVASACAAFAAGARTEELERLRVRAEDKDVDRGLPLARRARRERAPRRPSRELAERAEARRLHHALGPQGPRGAPARRDEQGPRRAPAAGATRDIDAALYAGDDLTDVDAFDALRALVAEGVLRRPCCVGVRSEETPAALARRGRRPRRRAAPASATCSTALAALAARCASSTCSGPRSCSAPARRRCWPSSPSLGATRDSDDTLVLIGGGLVGGGRR